jgi:hypothetical protein
MEGELSDFLLETECYLCLEKNYEFKINRNSRLSKEDILSLKEII